MDNKEKNKVALREKLIILSNEIKEIKKTLDDLKSITTEIKNSVSFIHYNTPQRNPGWIMGDWKSFNFRVSDTNNLKI
jgi:hypothetical protein